MLRGPYSRNYVIKNNNTISKDWTEVVESTSCIQALEEVFLNHAITCITVGVCSSGSI